MFNNVILDVAIGIVFIFLLYSLLATSVQEAIATILALRARTLKDGIVNRMLCDTPDISKLRSIWNGILDFFKELGYFFYRPPVADENKKLGHLFYDHPLIKNYGSNPVFPNPSYIPAKNFSTVLIDVLKADFDSKLDGIAAGKFSRTNCTQSLTQVTDALKREPDILKIKELLAYYKEQYAISGTTANRMRVEKDTLMILLMHFDHSAYQLDAFAQRLETWFDDTMNRVSGWYKRRTQFILFLIGITLAVLFNVDVIQLSGKLSTDKDARAELVQLAISQADTYRNDPRVDSTQKLRESPINQAKKTIDSGIIKANQLLALGWGDYGMKQDSEKIMTAYLQKYGRPLSPRETAADLFQKDSVKRLLALLANGPDTLKQQVTQLLAEGKHPLAIADVRVSALLDTLRKARTKTSGTLTRFSAGYNQLVLEAEYGWWHKTCYVFGQFTATRLMGFLLTAFAISLGSPFWFDLLNKLIKLRAAGKKEAGGDEVPVSGNPQPVQVTVTTPAAPGEEAAVG